MRSWWAAGWCALLLLGCGGEPGGGEDAVAWVEGEPITAADLEAEVARRGALETMRFATPEERRAILDDVIERRVLALNARRAGYESEPALRAELEQVLGRRFERELLRAHAPDLLVTAEEVEAEYRGNLDRYTEPERVQAALIWVPVPPGATPETRARLRARAEQAWQEARDPSAASGTFGALAVRYSSDFESRYRGGDIGWLERDSTDPRWGNAVARAVFALSEPGDLSEVIATEAGFAIARLVRRTERRTADLEEVEPRIRAELEARRRERVLVLLREELAGMARVQRDERRLDEIPLFAPLETARRSDGPG
jgi:parvulin-like peptidyl-prolyl isomerase